MSNDFKDLIELVRSRVDLVSLIGDTVKLSPSGSLYCGRLAPPSAENGAKNQSLVVWPESNSWWDFSQGFGGDCFSWMERVQKRSFRESVFELAARYGVPIPEQNQEAWQEELRLLVERRKIFRMLSDAAHYYRTRLPKEVRRKWYQEHYGLSLETVNKYLLGYADGHLYTHLTVELGYSKEEALSTGLFVETRGGVEDFFQGRLVFPYWKGRSVVYFIARQIPGLTPDQPWEKGKYKKLLTHSEKFDYVSPLVTNEWFYGEDEGIGVEEVLITEGVTDCLSALQSGIPCISPVTTRFRKADVPKLLELTKRAKRIVLCNDNEENHAGEKGARETAQALWAAGRDVRFAIIPKPEGRAKIDLNELVKEQGDAALKSIIASALTWPEYLVENVPKDTAQANLPVLLAPAFEALATADEIMQEGVLKRISQRFGLTKKVLASTLREAKKKVSRGVEAEAPPDTGRPSVRIGGRQVRDVIMDTAAVILPANKKLIEERSISPEHPILFKRFGRLTQMRDDGRGKLRINECNEASVYGVFVRAVDWHSIDDEGRVRHSVPPKDVCKDMIAFPPADLPELDDVIYTPVFGRTGELLTAAGYHSSDRTWLHVDPTLGEVKVPLCPSKKDVEEARRLFFEEALVDFSFVSDCDRAHMMAAILLPFARRMINGPTPLHVVEAPAVGSGKSLLCNVANVVAVGREAEMTTLPVEEEEVRKQLTAELVDASPILVLDNAREGKQLGSESLASALTSRVWKTRILGRSERIELPNNVTWMLTGNNVSMTSEIARRSVRIRIDPGTAKAWRRSGFRHPNLIEWAKENRNALVSAALTLIQHWIVIGKPRGSERIGSFEDWSAVMGGILSAAGISGMLGNVQQVNEDHDSESRAFEHFVKCWWDQYRGRTVTTSELERMCSQLDLLEDLIADPTPQQRVRRLGRVMGMSKDRVFGSYKILSAGYDHKGRAQYQLKDLTGLSKPLPPEEPGAAPDRPWSAEEYVREHEAPEATAPREPERRVVAPEPEPEILDDDLEDDPFEDL